ncbi:hypothetical protein BN7_3817 [Wickerhamomyces ciferrii]|uniref:Uncharacterized protein n=1 Tax=Wickerhamomyces ciferrii (strain ATCC 14091 / BCRC 22168 / CBS 111 / JCM 3599 / NBRC 0793 / NRRL Y-1031 F-60-10) TaxID=1206466 RepID=K0KMU2_WICCF|nr:uncharacterized protein BN7_3817 [Wickerhamomyces ciferrii]CCH44256.1 hypothetical protein BN7_3817 [Wickerhamomyces ciferrii]
MSAVGFIDAKKHLYNVVLEEVSNSKKNLRELEEWRINELPKIVQKRYETEPELYLTKPELKQLMNWKL